MLNLRSSSLISLKVILILVVFLLLSSCDEKNSLPERTLDTPLVLIGLDGAEWSVMTPMLERGELPNIQKLIDSGVSTGLINPGAMISPPVWTTFITGEHPAKHGILDHVFPYDGSSPKQPVDSTLRLKPALWNIASEAGLRSAVFGYFASWPAEDINGLIVSDRALQGFPNSIFPETMVPEIQKLADKLALKKGKNEFLKRYYPWGYRVRQASDPKSPYHKAARLIVGRADRTFLNDELVRQSALSIQSNAYDFIVVYLRSADLASHSFWREYDDNGFASPADPELKKLLGNVIPESYRFLDESIGDLMEKFGSNANYVVVSDHGFASAKKELVVQNKFNSVLTGNHLPVGVFIASGPDIRSESDLKSGLQVTSLDIMPTLTRLLDLPIAENISGKTLGSILTPKFKKSHPVKTIVAYEMDGFARPYNSAELVNQAAELGSLTGLGYIGGESASGNSDTMQYDFWNAKDTLIVQHISGELIDSMLRNNKLQAGCIYQEFVQNKMHLVEVLLHNTKIRLKTIAQSARLNRPIKVQKIIREIKNFQNNSLVCKSIREE